jgi:hypothetical protein
MSEYQYYEFQALDQPLTDEARQDMRRLSSRVHLTANSASFVYNYSDFRGNPVDVLSKYFDAMLYITNWGTRQLMFRFPWQAIPSQVQEHYQYAENLEWTKLRDYVILNIEYHDESGDWGWVEGEGWLPSIVPVRHDILRGDRRALCLAWLIIARDEFEILENGEELISPPVPPNLQSLSPALENFVAFFDLDPDLVTAAAQFSPTVTPSDEALGAHLDRLSDDEKDRILRLLLRGEAHLDITLAARLRELAGSGEAVTLPETRCSLRQLIDDARRIAQQRLERERKQAEIERLKKLEQVAQHEAELWARIPGLIAQKKANAYDEAVSILKDLRDLAVHQNRSAAFRAQMIAIKECHPTLRGLHQRMDKASLI